MIGSKTKKQEQQSTPPVQAVDMPQAPIAQDFKSKEIFDQLEALLENDGDTLVGKVKGIYLFKVKTVSLEQGMDFGFSMLKMVQDQLSLKGKVNIH